MAIASNDPALARFDAGDSYVRARAWQMIGAAAVAGVLLSLLVSRR
jgi:ElaB/YqjD/DUF883 family membrane-anchored ribosome-binding protein